MSPDAARANRRANDRPKPAPRDTPGVMPAAEPRTPGSKIFSRSSSATPGPSSSTVNRISLPFRAAPRITLVFANLHAFSTTGWMI
jgi:hypothetical protein